MGKKSRRSSRKSDSEVSPLNETQTAFGARLINKIMRMRRRELALVRDLYPAELITALDLKIFSSKGPNDTLKDRLARAEVIRDGRLNPI